MSELKSKRKYLKPIGQLRRNTISVQVTDDEYAHVYQWASLNNTTIAGTILHALYTSGVVKEVDK